MSSNSICRPYMTPLKRLPRLGLLQEGYRRHKLTAMLQPKKTTPLCKMNLAPKKEVSSKSGSFGIHVESQKCNAPNKVSKQPRGQHKECPPGGRNMSLICFRSATCDCVPLARSTCKPNQGISASFDDKGAPLTGECG